MSKSVEFTHNVIYARANARPIGFSESRPVKRVLNELCRLRSEGRFIAEMFADQIKASSASLNVAMVKMKEPECNSLLTLSDQLGQASARWKDVLMTTREIEGVRPLDVTCIN